jgi:hypothetical protein
MLAHATYSVDLGAGFPSIVEGGLLLDSWADGDDPVGLVRVTFALPEFTEIDGRIWAQPKGKLDDDGPEFFAIYVGDRAIYAGGEYGADLSTESRGWLFSETFAEPQTQITLEVASDTEGEALLLYYAQVWAR